MYPLFGSPQLGAPLEVVSRCLFHVDFAEPEWTADGLLIARSGHLGSFSRGASLASVADSLGTTYAAANSQPAWEARDLDGDTIREAFGLRMGADDRLPFDDPPPPQALSGLLEFVETGARTTANATLFAITNDAVSGARLWLDTSGTYYRINWSDGATTRTATLTVGQPTSGQRVRLRWTLSATGVVTLWQSINGAAETTATAAPLMLPTAWASGARVRLNSRGDTENPAQGWYRRLKLADVALDVATLDVLR